MGKACNTHETGEKCIQNVGRNTCREEITGKRIRRWEDNLKIDLGETGEGTDLFHPAEDRDQSVMNFWVP